MERQILRRLDVQRVTGLSKATIWRLVKEGSFPRPVRLGARAVGWRADEVVSWIDSRPRTTTEGAPE